jgi:hypothetical protein
MQAIYLTFGLQRQLTEVAQSAAWLGVWFGLTAEARDRAERSAAWSVLAGTAIWSREFLRVHALVWRLLLTLLLFRCAGFLSAVAGKVLSLQFHHANHFERMQARHARPQLL